MAISQIFLRPVVSGAPAPVNQQDNIAFSHHAVVGSYALLLNGNILVSGISYGDFGSDLDDDITSAAGGVVSSSVGGASTGNIRLTYVGALGGQAITQVSFDPASSTLAAQGSIGSPSVQTAGGTGMIEAVVSWDFTADVGLSATQLQLSFNGPHSPQNGSFSPIGDDVVDQAALQVYCDASFGSGQSTVSVSASIAIVTITGHVNLDGGGSVPAGTPITSVGGGDAGATTPVVSTQGSLGATEVEIIPAVSGDGGTYAMSNPNNSTNAFNIPFDTNSPSSFAGLTGITFVKNMDGTWAATWDTAGVVALPLTTDGSGLTQSITTVITTPVAGHS